ncbi:transposase [Pseudoloma neurophilia]|uniref:Transposase n=1 Tax=Pseudoloma neurophilia TaxID=146866 RepID=A0A0R0LZ64_9MICR|nr:transposase [Pseudoloma neurophilia]
MRPFRHMGEHTDLFMKGKIVAYNECGYSSADIALMTNILKSTICRILNNFKATGSPARKIGSGRKKILTPRNTKVLERISEDNPRLLSGEISKQFSKETGLVVSRTTIRSYLKDCGLKCRTARKKPKLTQRHILLRFKLSKIFITYADEFWSTVIFTDEFTVQFAPTKKNTLIYRRNGEAFEEKNIVKTTKYGAGKVMFWAAISANGVGIIVPIEGNMNAGVYVNILSNNLELAARKMQMSSYILMHDCASCHTSKFVEDWLKTKNISVLNWAPQSPDLNPIENLFAIMKSEAEKFSFKNRSEVITKVIEILNNIQKDLCGKLVNSMPDRVKCMYAAKGKSTKY